MCSVELGRSFQEFTCHCDLLDIADFITSVKSPTTVPSLLAVSEATPFIRGGITKIYLWVLLWPLFGPAGNLKSAARGT